MKALLMAIFFSNLYARADLIVKYEPVNVVGHEALIKLNMRNTFSLKIQSARAVVFLMDSQGSVVGQSVKWVITGQKDFPALPPGGTNQFNFVVPLNRTIDTTNLTAKVQFNRVTLENGQPVNIPTSVTVIESKK